MRICVLDAPKVVSLILQVNTIGTKFKVKGDLVSPMTPRLSLGFLPTELRGSGMSTFACFFGVG